MPPEQPTQFKANNRGDEPIAVLVVFHHLRGLFFTEKTVRCGKVLRTDRHLFVGLCFNIANPVGVGTESIYHHHLGTFLPVVDDFQNGLAPEASAPGAG